MRERTAPDHDLAWRERFLASTRGRILALLRQRSRTAAELADGLAISPNAARAHLASLERDGLVEARGVRREGVGKPPRVYAATAAAETLFPKAYDAVLASLLDVVEERLGTARLRSLLREAGRLAGRDAGDPAADPLERAVAVLAELGAEVEASEAEDGIWLRGHACPLGALVPRRPELCELMAVLLEEVTGESVADHCRRESPGRPRCAFLVRARWRP